MQEISLNIMDIVQNSINAKANRIIISIVINTNEDFLSVRIEDNGKGMSSNQLKRIHDPFYSTRTSRKIGLGIPFLKHASESTGGSFSVDSVLNQGTIISAKFVFSHINRMPLGNIVSTIHLLITMNPNINFIYRYKLNNKEFFLDTNDLHDILGDIPFSVAKISKFIKEYLKEQHDNINKDKYI